MPELVNIPAIISLLALGGFGISFYIRYKKTYNKSLVCPFRSRCETVIYSQYSRFFGIPLELLGLTYYGLVAAIYALFSVGLFTSGVSAFTLGLFAITLCAFLFSLYLIMIQLFTLKEWCAWCMFSAFICTLILSATIINLADSFVPLLASYKTVIGIIHLLGFALGLGGATLTDVFFFRSLRDFKVSETEAETMNTVSQVIWFGLGLLVISGLGLYFPNAEALNQNPKFLIKALIVGVILVNGFLLNLIVSPRLVKISFGEKHEHEMGELRRSRRVAFALGGISLTSWYCAFVLGAIRTTPFYFPQLLVSYLVLLIMAVLISQLMEAIISRKTQIN